jgi:uncharacterized protein YdeI (YjbR/CyaY-like superfamily)
MPKEFEEHYFKSDTAWRQWLVSYHESSPGIYLIFFAVAHENDSMRWEEAVRVALCFGWIDSTVKSLGHGKRRQYFCPRKPKSVWSRVNKVHIKELTQAGLMHESGIRAITNAKQNGSWTALDAVENGIIPEDLQLAFDQHPLAFQNYQNFTRSQRKSYLYWLNQAKKNDTRQKRIVEIISNCANNIKTRGW